MALPLDRVMRNGLKSPSLKSLSLLPLVVLPLAGCERAPAWQYSSSEQVSALSPELQAQVRTALDKHCGTPSHPRLLGSDDISIGQDRKNTRLNSSHYSRSRMPSSA